MPANFIYQLPSDQCVDDATLSLGTGSLASGYALSALHNGNPASPMLLSAATTFYVLLDFGASVTKAMKLFAFIGHNFDPGITLVVQGNASNSWGAPTVNSSVVVPAVQSDASPTDFYWMSSSQTTALRWWRIGTTTTNSAAWRLGELWASTTLRSLPARNLRDSTMRVRQNYRVVEHVTPSGVSMRYRSPFAIRSIEGAVDFTEASINTVMGWHAACFGRALPTVCIPNDSLSGTTGLYPAYYVVHTTDELEKSSIGGDLWRITLALRTLSNGVAA